MADTTLRLLSEHGCFGGVQRFYEHDSVAIGLPMRFSVFLPAQAVPGDARDKVPAVVYLAGLTCNEETFMIKAGAQRRAAELGIALFVSQRTQAPQVMVAVLLLVNTVAVAALQVRLSRSAESVATGGRALVRGGALIAAGFTLIGLADGRAPWVAVTVLLAGALVHVVGEMLGSGGQWALQMGLAPHEKQGQYQGFASLGFALMHVIGPGIVTLLCVHGGTLGWVAMGTLILASGVAAQGLGRWALANRAAYGVHTHSG